MAEFSISNVSIKGISAAVPKNRESNWDYDLISEKERKLLIKTTGIEFRHTAIEGQTTSDLCYVAAERLISDLKWNKNDISVIVFLSQSMDYLLPATAIILQDRLGLPKSCMAFDVGLGCSGYVYGLSIISSLLSATGLSKALLLVGDVSSATCSREDKSTYPLFGDAGTATALEFDSEAKPMFFGLNSDGSGAEAIMIKAGGIRNLASKDSFEMKDVSPGIRRSDFNLALNGLEVFNFSLREIPSSIKSFLSQLPLEEQNFDKFIMHQANKLMNESIRKKLKIDSEKVPYSLSEYGNSSSASIPLTIVSEIREFVQNNKAELLLTGFGVGLSWGVVKLEVDKITCPNVIEV